MSNKNTISLKDAQQQFSELTNALRPSDKSAFITYVFEKLTAYDDCDYPENYPDDAVKFNDEVLVDPAVTLNTIAADIKSRVPLNATLPSESIRFPTIGENSDCLPDLTVHVDDFLYNEHEVEQLVDDGKLRKNYCKDCGSRNVDPLIFISHSLSRDALYYIFSVRLPLLNNKTVLDVGSRLGAVLYGAYVYTDASKIIGVEMNKDFCELQNDIIQKYKMGDRIEVFHKKIEEASDLVKSADVIVINNAFEFYHSEEKQIEIWEFFKKNVKSKAILVTCPHLETTFKNLDIDINLDHWVKTYLLSEDENCLGTIDANYSDFCDIGFYEVL